MPVNPLRQESLKLRAVMRAPSLSLRFTVHARQEMAADQIIEADVRRVLDLGSVTWTETKREELWHVEGRDLTEDQSGSW